MQFKLAKLGSFQCHLHFSELGSFDFSGQAMSAILIPIRFGQNPIGTRLFQGRIGPSLSRILAGSPRFPNSGLTRVAAHSNSSNPSTNSEKEAALAAAAAAASTPPDSPTM